MPYSTPQSIVKGINADFYKRLQEKGEPLFKNKVYAYIPTEGAYEDYLFNGNYRSIAEWTAQPTWSNFYNTDYKYTITNKDWITGQIAIKKSHFEAAKNGLGGNYELAMKGAVDTWYSYPWSLIAALCDANGNAFDGEAFFANSRTSPNVDNIYPGTGTSLTQIYTDMKGAIDQMLAMTDENGNAFNITPSWVVMIPGHLFSKFNQLRVNDTLYLTGTESNSVKGLFDICINPYLGSSDNDWYLINSNAPVPPFIYQVQKEPEWKVEDIVSDPYYHFFATASSQAGYGSPFGIVLVSNTGY